MPHSTTTFEYYSTFAPMAGTFLAEEPATSPMDAYRITKTLRSIDSGYYIYSSNKGSHKPFLPKQK